MVCFDVLSRPLSLFSQGLKLNMALRSVGSLEQEEEPEVKESSWAGPWGDADCFQFPAGRAPLGPGPVHPEGPQCPEGAAGGCIGETPQRTEEMSYMEGEASSGVTRAWLGRQRSRESCLRDVLVP